MSEYKSVKKFLEKYKSESKFKRFISRFVMSILVCILLFLVILIVLKVDKNSNQVIYKYLYENNINFAGFNKFYKKHFGDILPFQSISNNLDREVFEEKLVYDEASIYKDGVKLKTSFNYLVPILDNGIVVFIGNKDDFNKTVIIQQENGVNVWYGNLSNLNVKIYDYVKKGSFLGETMDDNLYLLFEKDGKYLNYKDFIK